MEVRTVVGKKLGRGTGGLLGSWYYSLPRDSQESSPTPQFKSINSSLLSLLHTAAQEARSPDSLSAIRPHHTSSTGPSSRAPPPPQPAIPGVCGIRLDCSSVLFSQSDVLADTELGKGGRGSFPPLLASSTTTAGVQEGGGPTHIARCSGVGRGQRRGASVQRQACRPAVSEEGCSGGTRPQRAPSPHPHKLTQFKN